ncbi:hypothetical protein KGQ20_15435 [Catenulispora sp. NF23]|uniref:Uncharacterized protein n=1 Tax=Catenulispora pinistramenti TaxID=2705254 RepID=A0ABS5KUW8_9ACTN|nr:hypothetical protein [Catenulispora pinistramenti]MBS2534163.1 hypothetical protein [Catenulispora pinistramenti]MBS2549799.1 hypothetical protein [Catenulispora pinistramenti]
MKPPTTPEARTRRALRAAALGSLAAVPLLLASPAFALHRDAGDDPGPGMSAVATILVYIGIPAAIFCVIALLVLAPSIARGNRYRPHQLSWWAAPVWFGGPRDERGDTADRALTGTSLKELTAYSEAQTEGGASARW